MFVWRNRNKGNYFCCILKSSSYVIYSSNYSLAVTEMVQKWKAAAWWLQPLTSSLQSKNSKKTHTSAGRRIYSEISLCLSVSFSYMKQQHWQNLSYSSNVSVGEREWRQAPSSWRTSDWTSGGFLKEQTGANRRLQLLFSHPTWWRQPRRRTDRSQMGLSSHLAF